MSPRGPRAARAARSPDGRPVVGVAFTPDNKSVVAAGATRSSGSGRRPPSASSPATRDRSSASPSLPTASQVVTASADKTVKVFDVATGNVVRSLAGHGDAVRAVAVTKDGAKIVSGSADKTIKTWNAADGKLLLTYPPQPTAVLSVAASADNKPFVAGLADGRRQALRPGPDRPGQGRAARLRRATPARSSRWPSCPTAPRSSRPRKTRRSSSGPRSRRAP